MSTWEERMAAQSAAKGRTYRQQVLEHAEEDDEHAGHHAHLAGTAVECSCGKFLGLACVALPDLKTAGEWQAFTDSLACRECGKKGVTGPLED